MKRMLLASVALAVLFPAYQFALAADLPQKPVYIQPTVVIAPAPSWTGCYVGGNIGADWGRSSASASTGSSVSWTNTGFIGGAQIGCDYQFSGGFVIGARDMLNGTSLNSGATFSGGGAVGYTVNSDISWVNTLTARIGYTVMPNALLYFQGGWAWARANAYANNPGGAQVAQFAGNTSGWTIGGGLEYLIVPHWSAFLEYNYMDFGTSGTAAVAVAGSVNLKSDAQTLLVGINYRF